jgi:DNA polymerase-1
MLINCDLKQIEVVTLAELSQDKGFIELLRSGVDIYKYFASIMYDKPEAEVTKEERNSLKVPILGMSYGRGAKALAEETGNSEEWCKEFIQSFYDQFPGVRELHKRWIETVSKTGDLLMFDGIRLKFKYYEKTWSDDYQCWFKEGYKPTEIKNYPVQHTAFVFISLFLTEFLRRKALFKRDKYLLINTVHDSIMLDCRPEFVDEAKRDLQEVLDSLPQKAYNIYRLKLSVPIRADITCGDNWLELG